MRIPRKDFRDELLEVINFKVEYRSDWARTRTIRTDPSITDPLLSH
ncbi:MAG: hypothetical protein GY880_33305 [Planctomycetaceae bacterium]|nr:hypothetical protein [Planctomycetaceae bacterium]